MLNKYPLTIIGAIVLLFFWSIAMQIRQGRLYQALKEEREAHMNQQVEALKHMIKFQDQFYALQLQVRWCSTNIGNLYQKTHDNTDALDALCTSTEALAFVVTNRFPTPRQP